MAAGGWERKKAVSGIRFQKDEGEPLVEIHGRNPEDLDAERSVLATLGTGDCLDAAEVVFALSEEDFAHPKHQKVFRAIKEQVSSGDDINAITIKGRLQQNGELGFVGGYQGLVDLLSYEVAARPMALVQILVRQRKLRATIKIGAEMVREALDGATAPEVLAAGAVGDLIAIGEDRARQRGLERLSEILPGVVSSVEDLVHGNPEQRVGGVKVDMPRMDHLMGTLKPGELIVLAARPGIGKTAMALNWAYRSALRWGTRGGFFSLEMSRDEVVKRLVVMHSRRMNCNVNLRRFGDDRLSFPMEEAIRELGKVYDIRDGLNPLPIWIDDTATITVPEMRSRIERKMAEEPLDFLVVDYLQLMSSPADGRASRQNEAVRIGDISRGFKLMAKDFGVPVVVMSQLNREVEHRQGGRPQLSDLRDSGAVEQDADKVIFIHGKPIPKGGESGDGEPQIENRREAIIAKNRNGPLGVVPLIFEGDFQTFYEETRETDPYQGIHQPQPR